MERSKGEAGALACLAETVEMLRAAGLDKPESDEMLLAYAALVRIKTTARAFGVPLEEIGLADFDPDELLQPRKAGGRARRN